MLVKKYKKLNHPFWRCNIVLSRRPCCTCTKPDTLLRTFWIVLTQRNPGCERKIGLNWNAWEITLSARDGDFIAKIVRLDRYALYFICKIIVCRLYIKCITHGMDIQNIFSRTQLRLFKGDDGCFVVFGLDGIQIWYIIFKCNMYKTINLYIGPSIN